MILIDTFTNQSLNFEESPGLLSLFDGDISPQKIITNIELLQGIKIEPKTTLIFLDEIQLAPSAITSLKYFEEKAFEYHIIATGYSAGGI